MVESASLKSSLKKKILLLYPYYWPHYKAGGPVQSLFNLVGVFQDNADFYLFSLDHDIDGQLSNHKFKLNEWTKGPQNENIYFVSEFSPFLILKLIRQVRPDVILLNGIFNIQTTLSGLIIGKFSGMRIIISPRGMLQDWALRRNRFLKSAFLFLFKLLLKRNEAWHATNDQEKLDILRIFGPDQQVSVASNIPRKVSEFSKAEFPDENGKIRLVFLSLINPNKNLHLIIHAVCRSGSSFILDIYGPVIDREYWKLCLNMISNETRVTYKGPVPPWEVPSILGRYHFFVLPTQGENFGHAIFDALASGVPVIISRNTPWQEIEKACAGFYTNIDQPDSLQRVLGLIAEMSAEDYNELRLGSIRYATEYWNRKNYHDDYAFLFKD